MISGGSIRISCSSLGKRRFVPDVSPHRALRSSTPETGLTSPRGRATTEGEPQKCFWGAHGEEAMNRETLICEIQRALKEQTGDYPMDFAELSDRTLEGLALLLGELKGERRAAVRSACDTFLRETKGQECLCFGPPVDDCPTHGSRGTKRRRR